MELALSHFIHVPLYTASYVTNSNINAVYRHVSAYKIGIRVVCILFYRETKKIRINIPVFFIVQQILDVTTAVVLLIFLNLFPFFYPSCQELPGMNKVHVEPVTFLWF